ncbi:MAG: dTDP-4-dehydrorhamnose reductase [Pikeienuella sp.]
MRVLVFGQSGQVATEIIRRGGDATITALSSSDADFLHPDDCAAIVQWTEADVIINAAAYTNVDGAESEPNAATMINAETPGAIAREAAKRDIPFVHISTDYVFDGKTGTAWREDDATGPLSVYGQSKLAGEQAITAAGGPHAILRTSWVFSAHGGNFVKTMLRVGAGRDALNVVDDQIGGPTAAADIADAVLAIARAFHEGRGVSGIYHFAGGPDVSWRGFAEAIFGTAGMDVTANGITTAEWPTPAARPPNSKMDCSKITADYGIARPDWRVALADVLAELK